MNQTQKGLLSAFGFSVFWATTGITVKLLPDLSPTFITTARCLFAYIALLLIYASMGKSIRTLREVKKYKPGGWILLFMMIAYIFMVVLAYQWAPVAEVVLINGCSPVFVLIYKKIVYKKLPLSEFIGALLALAGLLIVVLPGLFEPSSGNRMGLIFALISSALIASYAILFYELELRRISPDPFSITINVFLLGSILFAIIQYFSSYNDSIFDLSTSERLFLISIGVLSTAVPTFCYSFSSRTLPPVITTSFRMLTPVLATLFAYIIFLSIPKWSVYPGGALILMGLMTMTL
ncbi:MAG: DMT family transporter, partial [Bacteroidota bacterium]